MRVLGRVQEGMAVGRKDRRWRDNTSPLGRACSVGTAIATGTSHAGLIVDAPRKTESASSVDPGSPSTGRAAAHDSSEKGCKAEFPPHRRCLPCLRSSLLRQHRSCSSVAGIAIELRTVTRAGVYRVGMIPSFLPHSPCRGHLSLWTVEEHVSRCRPHSFLLPVPIPRLASATLPRRRPRLYPPSFHWASRGTSALAPSHLVYRPEHAFLALAHHSGAAAAAADQCPGPSWRLR